MKVKHRNIVNGEDTKQSKKHIESQGLEFECDLTKERERKGLRELGGSLWRSRDQRGTANLKNDRVEEVVKGSKRENKVHTTECFVGGL